MHQYGSKYFAPALGVGSKGQNIFTEKVMLQVKLKGMDCRAPCKQIFCPYTHPQPRGWCQLF